MLVVLLAVMLTVRRMIKPIFCYQTYSLSGSPPWTSWCQGPAAMPLHGVLPSPLPSQVHGQRVPHRREILTDLPGQEEGDPALPSLLSGGGVWRNIRPLCGLLFPHVLGLAGSSRKIFCSALEIRLRGKQCGLCNQSVLEIELISTARSIYIILMICSQEISW